MEDQEKLSLRKQVEILNLQKDVLSRQISKLRDDIAAEKTAFQQTQTKLQDDIRVKDIEIRAVRNYMEKHSVEIKNQLKEEFYALEMEKERIAEVTKELDARRSMIESLVTAKQAEFEKQLRTEKELFEKSREDYLKNTKKLQAAVDEHIHKGATETNYLEKEITDLRKQLLLKDRAIADIEISSLADRKEAISVDNNTKDARIEELKKEIELLVANKEALSRALDEKTNLLSAENNSAETLKKSSGQIKAAMFAREKEIAEKITQYKEKMSELNSETDSLKKDNKKLAESTKRLPALENEKKALLDKIDNLRLRSQNSEKTADALLVAIQKNETLQKLNAALENKLSKQESAGDKKHKKSAATAKPRSAEKFKCSECGAIVGSHDKKCPSCGEKFE